MLNKGILVVFFFIHGANNLFYFILFIFYFILFQCNVTNFQVRILCTFYFMLEKKTYLYFKYCLFIFIFCWIGEDQSDEWSGTGSCARQKGGSWSSAVRRDLGGRGGDGADLNLLLFSISSFSAHRVHIDFFFSFALPFVGLVCWSFPFSWWWWVCCLLFLGE